MDGRVLLASLAHVGRERALLRPRAGAAEHARGPRRPGSSRPTCDEPPDGRKRLWGRNALVVAQVAMSLMLLAASFLMSRGFQHSLLQGTGFPKDHLLMVRFDPRLVQYDAAQTQQFYELLAERMRHTPGVESAALHAEPAARARRLRAVAFVPDGFQMPRDREHFTAAMDTVDEGFFETMGIPILRGRGFPAVRHRGRAARRGRQRAVRQALLAGRRRRRASASGSTARPARRSRSSASRRRSSTADERERPTDFVYLPLPSIRRRGWSCC